MREGYAKSLMLVYTAVPKFAYASLATFACASMLNSPTLHCMVALDLEGEELILDSNITLVLKHAQAH
jgi:hypothetical protein